MSSGRPPLRVAMLIPYDLFYQPFTIRTTMFARELVRRGHTVRIYYRELLDETRGNRVHFSVPEGCEVRVVSHLKRSGTRRALLQELRDFDIIHFQKSLPLTAQFALYAARKLEKPIHQDWDDYEFAFWCQATRDAWRNEAHLYRKVRRIWRCVKAAVLTGSMERVIPGSVDTIGAASMYLRNKSLKWGARPEDVFPARVGVDVTRFHPQKRDPELRERLGLRGPTILFAGSFDVHPDLVFFAESLKKLLQQVPEAQCLIVGGGFGRGRFVELLGSGVPRDAVVMTQGLVPFEEMPRYVASADIAALPFRDTPVNRCKSSLTMMECMASGLPIVTHDVGDAGWIAGEGGIVVPGGDSSAFAGAIARLASEPDVRERVGRAARDRAALRFTWERSVDFLEEAYYHAFAKHANESSAVTPPGRPRHLRSS